MIEMSLDDLESFSYLFTGILARAVLRREGKQHIHVHKASGWAGEA